MTIWIDADNCSHAVRRIIERASVRRKINSVFVAAVPVGVSESRYVAFERVAPEDGSADDYIAGNVEPGDLVVSADIPLAYKVAGAGAVVVNPRGDTYTSETVGERRSTRDFMAALRSRGVIPSPRRKKSSRAAAGRFADHFDKALTRLSRSDDATT
jgi:uncharacterized protein YaiI (UPF0178 family)